jgi:hypothetical protein
LREKHLAANSPTAPSFSKILQPAPAWIAILGLVLFTVAGILVGAGKMLNLAFPVGAFAVGAFLYFRYPLLYLSFSWWLWFLTAFVRRLLDYRTSFTNPSPLLLAPYLVTGITLVTVLRYLPQARRQGGLPFVLPLAGLFYSFLIALVYQSPFEAFRGLLEWLPQVCMGFHLWLNWRDYQQYRQTIQRTFTWGILVIGVYGIVQYLIAPAWDVSWLIDSEQIFANGYPGQSPGPFAIRVFSTMQSVEPLSAFLAGGLLILFSYPSALRFPASVAGYLTFLLTLARSAWLGWLGGVLVFVSALRASLQMRFLITFALVVVLLLPLMALEPFSEIISSRLQTFSNVGEDESGQARASYFNRYIWSALTTSVGNGISRETIDNTILAMLFQLGWLGTLLYLAGLVALIFKLFEKSAAQRDLFVVAARAIVVSVLVRVPLNGAFQGASGLLLWSFLGIGLAAGKYYSRIQGSGVRSQESGVRFLDD